MPTQKHTHIHTHTLCQRGSHFFFYINKPNTNDISKEINTKAMYPCIFSNFTQTLWRSCTQPSLHFNIIKLGRKLCLLWLCGGECVVNWPVMWLLSEVDCLCNISPVNMSHQTLSLSPSVICIQCGYFKTRYTPLNVNSSLLVPLQNLIWKTYVSSWQGQKESCSSTLMNAYIIGKVTSNTWKLGIILKVTWSV